MPFSTYGSQDHGPARDERRHREVETIAYRLWEESGHPDGMRTHTESWQDHFWFEAEKQLRGAQGFTATLIGGAPGGAPFLDENTGR
jgi:Protein of unknown function (DUF2934)